MHNPQINTSLSDPLGWCFIWCCVFVLGLKALFVNFKNLKKQTMNKTLFLLIVIVLIRVESFAVDGNYHKDFDMDSTEFVETFGTLEQYNYQKSISRRSSHSFLHLFTGAKPMWFYYFAMYLGYEGLNVKFREEENKLVIEATPKVISGDQTFESLTLYATAYLNNDNLISKIKITGPADMVCGVFVHYWGIMDWSVNELKSKGHIYKNMVSDKVSFNWKNENPEIWITKNHDSAIDLFPLTKNK